MLNNVPTTSTPLAANPCADCVASSSKRASLKTFAGAALMLGTGLHNVVAADDMARAGDWLVSVDDDAMKPLTAADIKLGEKQLIVFPYDAAGKRARSDSRLNRILLVKPDPASLDGDAQKRAAEGVLAYSAVCTHQGCDVNSWRPKEQALLCFCHFSQFKPAEGAAVIAGPAPRPLPSLPLKIEDGKLVLAGTFSEAPGGAG